MATNRDRAYLAGLAVERFRQEAMPSDPDTFTAARDLICDLAHYVERIHSANALAVFAGALGVYLAEQYDEAGLAEEPDVTITWERPLSWDGIKLGLSRSDVQTLLGAIDLAETELYDRLECHRKHGEFEDDEIPAFRAELDRLEKLAARLRDETGEDR
jgi:hypothetical protein